MARAMRGSIAALAVLLATGARAALREETVYLPATLPDPLGGLHAVTLVVTVWRDDARERSPFLVLSHGRPGTAEGRAQVGRARYAQNAAWFVARGFAVVVPTRAGYGATGGPDLERAGACAAMDFPARFSGGAANVDAVLRWVRTQPWADPDRGLLAGQSFGGAASLALAAREPPGVRGVINFAGGGGGDPERHPEEPCSAAALARTMAGYGATVRVPSLWLYSENDRYWGPVKPRQWFEGYREQGGLARFVALPPVGMDGHGIFTLQPSAWHPAVEGFLRYLGFVP
jgi:dienelactone hydrolase